LGKISENRRGGGFLDSHCTIRSILNKIGESHLDKHHNTLKTTVLNSTLIHLTQQYSLQYSFIELR